MSKTIGQFAPSVSSGSAGRGTVATYAYDLLNLFFLPITIIWGIISSFFGLGGTVQQAQPPQQAAQTRPGQDRGNARLRRFGGVHDGRADDQDKTTYNGNSTQQL